MDPDDSGAKKFVRTFESDMKILKKGGAPDLSPLFEKPREPEPAPVPAPAPAPEPVIEPPSPEIFQPQNPPRIPSPPPFSVPPIKTYASDFSDQLKETNAARATVLAAEQDAAVPRIEPKSPPARGNILYIFAGIVLLIGGGVAGYFAYARYSASSAVVALAPVAQAPITVDEREQVSGTGSALAQAIAQSVNKPIGGSGSVRLLSPAGDSATDGVFGSLQLPAPGVLLRNVRPEGSMAGVVTVDGVQSPFFILSVASYSDTFSGMLSWEKTMPRDLAAFFPAYAAPNASTSMASSTTMTALSSPPAQAPSFRDETVGNHDARAYRDPQGRTILLYGYWNQETLIIARDQAAFKVLLDRLSNASAPL